MLDQLSPLLDEAYRDAPLSLPRVEQLRLALTPGAPVELQRARAFLLGRRTPTERLASLGTVLTPDVLDSFARGLAGRPRNVDTLTAFAPLWPPPGEIVSSSVAAALGRLQVRLGGPVAVAPLLTAVDPGRQSAGALLLGSPDVALPETGLWGATPAPLITASVRSLAARNDITPATWIFLAPLAAQRVAVAPRLWANTWRGVRDAIPATAPVEVLQALADAIPVADRAAASFPNATAAHWRCDNAIVHDRMTADGPAMTLACGGPGFEWVSQAAQATVLGFLSTLAPTVRATRLAQAIPLAHGDARVLEAIATSATTLPGALGVPIVRTLSTERDAGVLATLLEGLADHPGLARAVPVAITNALLAAPFQLPEAPYVEARIGAIRLGAVVGIPVFSPPTAIRAIALAAPAADDAGIAGTPLTATPGDTDPGDHLVLQTDAGSLDIELHPRSAPRAVQLVIDAARAHRYDGTTFHRVVPAFVTQGGDPRGDGYGGTDSTVSTELSFTPFVRGSVGIPLSGLDTGGTQLFVVTGDSPHLDGRYPWIGRVVRDLEVIDGILPGDRILSATVVPAQNARPSRTSAP